MGIIIVLTSQQFCVCLSGLNYLIQMRYFEKTLNFCVVVDIDTLKNKGIIYPFLAHLQPSVNFLYHFTIFNSGLLKLIPREIACKRVPMTIS